MPANDNNNDIDLLRPAPQAGEAHGLAALILVESLIHGLIDRSVLTTEESLDIVTTAVEVQTDYAAEANDDAPQMWRSLMLITTIAESLRIDADVAGTPATDMPRPVLVDVTNGSFTAPSSSAGSLHHVDGIVR